MAKIVKEVQFGEHLLVLETGEIARQADAAVFVCMNGTQVLVTVVARQEGAEKNNFFPLTVNYQEKTYAAGKIPGGFNKREGRPSEHETLICRLIDGRYPNYEAVIPLDNPNKMEVDRLSFLNAIRRVSIFSNKTTHQVKFRIAGSQVEISAEDVDYGNDADERLSCSYE